MNKNIIAALALGAVAGAGGKTIVENALGTASATPVTVFVHAVDLRRSYTVDAGSAVAISAYATTVGADGGTKDIGRAPNCKVSETTAAGARSLMNVLAHECVWP